MFENHRVGPPLGLKKKKSDMLLIEHKIRGSFMEKRSEIEHFVNE